MSEHKAEFRSSVVALMPKLRRFAFSLCGTAHDADDLVQSAIERALKNEAQWRPESRLDSWMYRIVQNLWIDQSRQRRSRGEVVPIEDLISATGEDGRNTMRNRSAAAKAMAAFADLSPEIKAAAALVIINGDSYREAADALDVPLGTIASRVARARIALETALNDEDDL